MTQSAETMPAPEHEDAAKRREKLEALRRDIQAGANSGSVGHIPLEQMLAEARKRFYGAL